MIEKILKYCITACSISILIVPLLVTKSTLFSYTFGKVVFFQIFVLIAAGAWILLALKNKAYRPHWKHPLILAPLLFLCSLFITSLVGINFYNSLWSSQERMLGLVTLFHYYVWLCILASVYTTWREWRTFFIVSSSVSILVFFLGLSGGITYQMQSTIGNQLF